MASAATAKAKTTRGKGRRSSRRNTRQESKIAPDTIVQGLQNGDQLFQYNWRDLQFTLNAMRDGKVDGCFKGQKYKLGAAMAFWLKRTNPRNKMRSELFCSEDDCTKYRHFKCSSLQNASVLATCKAHTAAHVFWKHDKATEDELNELTHGLRERKIDSIDDIDEKIAYCNGARRHCKIGTTRNAKYHSLHGALVYAHDGVPRCSHDDCEEMSAFRVNFKHPSGHIFSWLQCCPDHRPSYEGEGDDVGDDDDDE